MLSLFARSLRGGGGGGGAVRSVSVSSVRCRHDIKKWKEVSREETRERWGPRAPYVHGWNDNSEFSVEGVSDKQFPILLDWRRPERVSRVKPGEHGSGDLEGLPELDREDPVMRLEGVEEFERGSEALKKTKSLAFGKNKDLMDRIKRDMRRSVQRHDMDEESLEVAIARKTAIIRDLQRELGSLENYEVNPAKRHILKLSVDQRRGYLRRLREMDYGRFEWLLERLNLVYKPRPFFYERVEREKMLARLTDLWCEELKQHRLGELRRGLKRGQPKYLRDKADTLKWARKEQEELGMEVTVKEEEIEECLKRANEIEKELEEEEAKEPDYFIYKPEVIDTSQKY